MDVSAVLDSHLSFSYKLFSFDFCDLFRCFHLWWSLAETSLSFLAADGIEIANSVNETDRKQVKEERKIICTAG